MSITTKIIITDTNIITDLDIAGVLDKFVELDNVYISDMVLHDEINEKTGNYEVIKKMKVIKSSAEQLVEMQKLLMDTKKLSPYDLINYILAHDNDSILATGDNLLRSYAIENGVTVIRTLKIIQLMVEYDVICCEEAINACNLLLNSNKTRIPEQSIMDVIQELKKMLVIE